MPPPLVATTFGLFLGQERSDRFVEVLERRVLGIDDDLRDDGDDVALDVEAAQPVEQALLQHVADFALRFHHADFQRQSVGLAQGLLDPGQDVADLGAVAVGNQQFGIAAQQLRQRRQRTATRSRSCCHQHVRSFATGCQIDHTFYVYPDQTALRTLR